MHRRSKVAPAFSLCMCIADANICKNCTVFSGLLFIARELIINVKPGKRFLTPIHLLSVVGDFFMPPPLQVMFCAARVKMKTQTSTCAQNENALPEPESSLQASK